VFRKDEESAWTIVKSRQSTKRPLTSSLFTEFNDSVNFDETAPMESKHFDFENELIVGPVYKRVLFAHLCTLPVSKESSSKDTDETRTSDLSLSQSARSDTSQGIEIDINTDFATDGDVGWSPENIVKILKQSGGFSTSVLADLKEVKDASDSLRLPKRTLPLGSILKRNQMPPEAQKYQNAKLIMGAAMENAEQVAQALEDGAEINTVSDDGRTALQMSLKMSLTSDIAALLLLYREANRNFRGVTGEPILIEAVRRGNIALVRALITGVEDLRLTGNEGDPLLHVAMRSSHDGIEILKEISDAFADAKIKTDVYLDRYGRSALHVAVHERSRGHVVELIRLGCDPSFVPPMSKYTAWDETVASPLYFVLQSGDVELVQLIIEESSAAMPDLVNWRHHRQHSLLDSLRESRLPQRYLMAEVLIEHGAKWNITWMQPNHLLEFAIAGCSPSLFLAAISKGFFPMMKNIDIRQLLPDLEKNTNIDPAVRAFCTLLKSNSPDADDFKLSKASILARMTDREGPGSLVVVSSLIETLQGIIAIEEPAQSASKAAFSPTVLLVLWCRIVLQYRRSQARVVCRSVDTRGLERRS
jgi:ankyrin repeat protein